MAGRRTDDQPAPDRLKTEFEEAQRRMAEELRDTLHAVTSEGVADSVAPEWELDDTPYPALSPAGKLTRYRSAELAMYEIGGFRRRLQRLCSERQWLQADGKGAYRPARSA
jgi:hypothetical protein